MDVEALPSAFVRACINSNVLDHLLLRVGHLQGKALEIWTGREVRKPPILMAQSDIFSRYTKQRF